jgi:AraC-like DNA-binding protein
MDILTDVFSTFELRGWLSSRQEMVAPWRYDFAASKDSMFHILRFGGAYLQIEKESEFIRLEDGDVVLFPTGHPHSLYDHPTSPLTRVVQLDYHPERGHHILNDEGEGPKLLMLCGAFHFEYPHDFPLIHHLPTLIFIRGVRGNMEPGLADIVNIITRESASRQQGKEIMLRRLTELLFIQVIRLWIDQQVIGAAEWGGALRDPSIRTALVLMHQSPDYKWTVQELASAAALSRSAFSARFTELVGEPPMTYLMRWRMLRATRMLKSEVSMERIADQLGYESEAAFRKAFKREMGIPPAQYRKSG